MKRIISICIIITILAFAVGGCNAGLKSDSSGSGGTGGGAMYAPSAPSQASGGGSTAGGSTASGSSGGGSGGRGGDEAAPSQAQPADNASGGSQWEPGAEGSSGPLPILTPSNSRGMRYIYTIDLRLQTTAFMAGIRTLLNTVGKMDGYVESADVYGRDLHSPPHERNAEYSFRLYTERLADFLEVIEDNYNIVSLKQRSKDVTGNYNYGDTAIDDLRQQEARLLTALENTRLDTESRLDLEKRLTQVQSDIRYYEREQSDFDSGIYYSTVNVQLYEVIFVEEEEIEEQEEEEEAVPEPTFGERFNQAVERSVNGFLAFCQGVLIVLVRSAPVIIILVVLAVIAFLIYRRVRKNKSKHKTDED